MKVDVIISASDIKRKKLQGKVVVVIDVLRATSVIITALSNGCKEVIPAREIDEALDIVGNEREKYILGGERSALKIEGFDFSNSPLDYTKENVDGRTLVMTTSNGTRAIKNSEDAEHIFIAAMINAKAVAEKLVELNKDVVFVNAGTQGEFSIDDFITSGYIIEVLKGLTNVELTDISTTSNYIYKNNQDILSFVKFATHYNRIKELGLEEDLKYCLTKDIVDIVPEYKDSKIKI
ncbi:2-phosphosulfolactate phosphatase family protein [Clostridium sp.]|uniref:2-phosphosulfolactate phosphatase family protein n=1 Tax=Clostridium sp. TaxID=1506 RepID=UPI002FCA23F6